MTGKEQTRRKMALTEPQQQMRLTDLLAITVTNVDLNTSVLRHTAREGIWGYQLVVLWIPISLKAHATANNYRGRHDTYLFEVQFTTFP